MRPIGLLVKVFPKLSETFILEEILGLEKRGVPLQIYSLAAPTDRLVHPQVSRVLSAHKQVPQVRFNADFGWRLLRQLVSHPGRFFWSLWRAIQRGSAGLQDLVHAVWLADEMRRDGVWHLHTHFISKPADVAELASKLGAVQFSISAHAKDIYLSPPNELKRKLDAAQFVVTCTEFNRATLQALAPGARVHRMYHGLDRTLFQPRSATRMKGAVPRILSVGRLRTKKGLDTLIRACAELRSRGQPFACQIIGYGEERERLQRLIEALDLTQHVALTGAMTRSDVIEAYSQASVYVQPSRIDVDGDRDGIPNVLLEAMAMGLPVVASNISGIPELITHERNGLLVEPDEPAQLAQAVERILTQSTLASRLGEQAVASVAATFDNDQNLDLLCGLLGLRPKTRVAYVINGFPRLSETFIAHEIHHLQRLGQSLALFSVKREREALVHPVVQAIQAPLTYLPEATSLSGSNLVAWLRRNLAPFWPAHRALIQARPWAWCQTLCVALALAIRHRTEPWGLRKVFIKEFLQAGWIAHHARQDHDVGHLHGHFCHGVATITWFASRLSGLPFSFTAHAKDIYQSELNPGRLLERKLGAARFVATCTCANANVLRGRHPRPSEVHAIYHGLDTEWFRPETSRPSTAAPTLLAVGRWVEKKGFDRLIDACNLLKQRGVPLHCLIVGEDGESGAALRSQIEALDLTDTVSMQAAVTQDALRQIYQQAHAFVLPCRITADGDRDGFPNVLAEAMAMGVPVITTAISGIPEMIDDGVHGLLVSGDARSIADAVERLWCDDGLHARLSQSGRARICDRFDSRETTKALLALFAQASSNHTKTSLEMAA